MKYTILIRTIIITLIIVLTLGAFIKPNGNSSSITTQEDVSTFLISTPRTNRKLTEVQSGKITLYDAQSRILAQDGTSLILNRHFSLEGPIVAAKPFHGCDKIENRHLITNQTIVLVSDYWAFSCHPKTKIKNVQDTGAAGIIVARDGGEGGGGFLAHWMWPEDKSWIDINGVETASSDLEKMVQKNTEDLDSDSNATSYYVTVSPGVNGYQEMNTPVYQFFLGTNALESLITLALAVYKLRGFILYYGLEPSVTQLCLSLEIVASSLRMIAWIDPLFSRGLYPYGLGVFMVWLVQPFMFAILLMVSFYWYCGLMSMLMLPREQCISRTHLEVMPSLRRYRCLFITLSAIIAACYWANGVVRALFLSQKYPVVAVNVIFNNLICICVGIFYITVGIRVLRFLWNQKNLNRKNRDLRMTTAMIMLSAIMLILFTMFSFVFLSQPKIQLVVILFNIEFHLANGISLTVCLAFRTPQPSGESSQQTASNTSSKRERFTSASSYSTKTNDMEMDSQHESGTQTPAAAPEPTSIEPVSSTEPVTMAVQIVTAQEGTMEDVQHNPEPSVNRDEHA